MNRLIKWTAASLGLIAVVLIALVAAVTLLLNPNQFKPLIISQFKQFTGFEIQIPGNLSWTFLPRLGMEADEVEIKNSPEFTSKLKHLVLRVKMGPLLHRQVEFSRMSISELQLNQLQVTNISAKIRLKNQMLQIEPLTADLYQGGLRTAAHISLKQSPPNVHFAGNLKQVQLAKLMTGLSGKTPKLQLDGNANVTIDLTTQGKNTDELLRRLNGTGNLQLDKGILKGIDIAYYVETAAALINKQTLPSRTPGNQTEFGQVTGTANITNGILYNHDLVLDSPLYVVKGSGSINLVNRTLNYHLEVTAKPGKTNQKVLALYGKAVPISVSGSVDDPTVSLDTLALMQEIGKEQLQKVGEEIQKALPDKANKFIQSLFH